MTKVLRKIKDLVEKQQLKRKKKRNFNTMEKKN